MKKIFLAIPLLLSLQTLNVDSFEKPSKDIIYHTKSFEKQSKDIIYHTSTADITISNNFI